VQASGGVRLDHYAVTCMKRGKIARLLADSVMGANHEARAERRIDLTSGVVVVWMMTMIAGTGFCSRSKLNPDLFRRYPPLR
jgi:hypothetical protein